MNINHCIYFLFVITIISACSFLSLFNLKTAIAAEDTITLSTDVQPSLILSLSSGTYLFGNLTSGTPKKGSAGPNNEQVKSAKQSFTTLSSQQDKTVFEKILDALGRFFVDLWQVITKPFRGTPANAIDTASLQSNHLYQANTSTDNLPSRTLYWNPDMGAVTLTKNGSAIASINSNDGAFYWDTDADQDTTYQYAINSVSTKQAEKSLATGTPAITALEAKVIEAQTKDNAQVEVKWVTQGIPSTSQVSYGYSAGSLSLPSPKTEALNEYHTVTLNNIKTDTTLYLQAKSTDSSGIASTSKEISVNIPQPTNQTVIQIIMQALTNWSKAVIFWLQGGNH